MAEAKDDKEKKAADEAAAKEADKGDTSAGSENTDRSSETGEGKEKKADESVPRSRLNEESAKRKDAERKLEALEKADRERAEADAKKNNDFQALADTRQKRIDELEAEVARLKPLADRADALEKSATESLQERVKALPEKLQKLAPKTHDELMDWLKGAEELAVDLKGESANGDAGKDGKSKTNGKVADAKKDAPRGAGTTPRASASEANKDELAAKARRQQAGFTQRSF